jgi:hypothetical protein
MGTPRTRVLSLITFVLLSFLSDASLASLTELSGPKQIRSKDMKHRFRSLQLSLDFVHHELPEVRRQ